MNLYYVAPPDKAFGDMKRACLIVWDGYKDSPGGYSEEKKNKILPIQNIGDNFMYMLAMFDMGNQNKVINLLSESTKKEVRDRMIAGGNDEYYLSQIGL